MEHAIVTTHDAEAYRRRLDLMKRTVAKGATDDEFDLFAEQCRRTGLDPFSRQIYCIQRKEKDRESGLYVAKMVTQISIDGMRLVAERSGKYAGQLGPFWCGADGQWSEVWLKQEPPSAAKIAVLRSDFKEPLWAVATFDQYKQVSASGNLNGLWAKMPALMLAKCAESLALRKAFPMELSGLYTGEEMGQEPTSAPAVTVLPETGEIIDAVPSTPPPTADRPYTPEALKARIKGIAENWTGTVSDKQRGLIAATLDDIYQDEGIRKEVQFYLTGFASLKEMPDGYAHALLKWLNPQKMESGDYAVDDDVLSEAPALINAARLAAGQQPLPL